MVRYSDKAVSSLSLLLLVTSNKRAAIAAAASSSSLLDQEHTKLVTSNDDGGGRARILITSKKNTASSTADEEYQQNMKMISSPRGTDEVLEETDAGILSSHHPTVDEITIIPHENSSRTLRRHSSGHRVPDSQRREKERHVRIH